MGWVESPVLTTITTTARDVTELDFPTITICREVESAAFWNLGEGGWGGICLMYQQSGVYPNFDEKNFPTITTCREVETVQSILLIQNIQNTICWKRLPHHHHLHLQLGRPC